MLRNIYFAIADYHSSAFCRNLPQLLTCYLRTVINTTMAFMESKFIAEK